MSFFRSPMDDDIAEIRSSQQFMMRILVKISKGVQEMIEAVDNLTAAVDAAVRVEGEALAKIQTDVTEIADLTAKLAAAQGSSVDMQLLADKAAALKSATDALAAVVEPQPAPVAPEPPPAA
jgi:hypothetical protein